MAKKQSVSEFLGIDISDLGDIGKIADKLEDVTKALEDQKKVRIQNSKAFKKLREVEIKALQELEKELEKTNNLQEEGKKQTIQLTTVAEERAEALGKVTQLQTENTKQLEGLEKIEAKLAKQQKVIIKLQKDLAKALAKTTKERDKGEKAASETLKLQNKIVKATSKEEKELEVLRQQLGKANKERREEAKIVDGQLDDFAQLAKRRNKASKVLKNLVASQKASNKEIKEASKNFSELNKQYKKANRAAEDYRDQVGKYDEAQKKGSASAKGFAAGILAIFTGAILKGIVKTRKQSREFQVVLSQIGNTAKVTFTALTEGFVNFVIPAIELAINKISQFMKIQELLSLGLTVFKSDEEKERIIELSKELVVLEARNKEIIVSLEKAKNPFEGYTKKVESTNEAVRKQIELADELLNKQALLSREISELRNEEELLQVKVDDTTNGFEKRIASNKELVKVGKERIDKEIEIAKLEEDIAVRKIKLDLEREGLLDKVTDAQIRDLSFLKDKELADNISIENLEALTNATQSLLEVQNNAAVEEKNNLRELNELQRDRFENELDFTIDAFDVQKTVNERRIADENLTLEERVSILDRTKKLAQESFDDQIELVKQFRAEKLATDLGITEDEARQQLKRIDLNNLVLEDDQRITRDKLRAADIDEITSKRILEIIRERKTATQDLLDAENDLLQQTSEIAKTLERDLQLLADSFSGELLQIDTQSLNELIVLSDKLLAIQKDTTLNQKQRAAATKEVLDEIKALEEKNVQDLLDIARGELQGRKAILNQELLDIKGNGVDEVKEREDINRQIIAIDQELTALKKAELDKRNEDTKESGEKDKQDAEERSALFKSQIQQSIALVNQFFDARIAREEEQLERLEKQGERDLLLAGDNEEAKKVIAQKNFDREEKQRKEIVKQQRKQAIFNKAIALADIVINTAIAATKIAAQTGVGAAALVPLTIAFGIAQAALVIAQPIPQFFKGTDDAPGGWAIVDEKGAEIHTDKHGQIKNLGQSKGARMVRTDKGDKIYTASQSKAIQNMLKDSDNVNVSNITESSFNSSGGIIEKLLIANSKGGKIDNEGLKRAVKEAIKIMPVYKTTIDENGFNRYQETVAGRIKYLNEKHKSIG